MIWLDDVAGASRTAPKGMRHTKDIEPAVAEGPQEALFPDHF